jgi:hypothetical protein
MSLLAECAGNTFLQVGVLRLTGSLRDELDAMMDVGLSSVDEYHRHQQDAQRGRLNPAWRQSMEDIDHALEDRFGVIDGQTHRALLAAGQVIQTDPRIDRAWVMGLAREQLAIHYAQRPSPSSITSRLIEQSHSPASIIMDAVTHHLALRETPFITEKAYPVTGEVERAAAAKMDDKYQVQFDFTPPERSDHRDSSFNQLMAQAYWQMHLGYARTAA